jgi:hypothetical protein
MSESLMSGEERVRKASQKEEAPIAGESEKRYLKLGHDAENEMSLI